MTIYNNLQDYLGTTQQTGGGSGGAFLTPKYGGLQDFLGTLRPGTTAYNSMQDYLGTLRPGTTEYNNIQDLLGPTQQPGGVSGGGSPPGTTQQPGGVSGGAFSTPPGTTQQPGGVSGGAVDLYGDIPSHPPAYVPPPPPPDTPPGPADVPPPPTPDPADLTNIYNIPTDVYPTTTSTGSSSSRSGINWDNPLNKAILPNLIGAGQGLQGYVDTLGAGLQDKYANQMRRAFSPENFQGVLNSLSNRGMLNSTIAENTLAKGSNLAAKTIADQAFEANIAQAQNQMAVPGILANIASLGQQTTSDSKTSSTSTNPLAPYELMSSLMGL